MPSFKKDEKKLDYQSLRKSLEECGPEKLYILWGPEDYLIRDFVSLLRKTCVNADTAQFDAKVIDDPAPALEDIEEALNAMPFFGGRTFLELQGFDINKCKDEKLVELLTDIPEWCTVVITLPTDIAPDGRLGHVKKLKAAGKAVEFTAQEDALLYRWMTQRFRSHGKTIERDAMNRLLFLSGNLMNRLIPEIEKICGYVSGERVTTADVDAVAHHIPEAQTFDMTDRIAVRNYEGAISILSELLAGDTSPVEIMALISWQMRQLYGARLCLDSGRGTAYFKEVTGCSDYMARKYAEAARGFTLNRLTDTVRLCAELTCRTRETGAALTDEEALKELLVRMSMEGADA